MLGMTFDDQEPVEEVQQRAVDTFWPSLQSSGGKNSTSYTMMMVTMTTMLTLMMTVTMRVMTVMKMKMVTMIWQGYFSGGAGYVLSLAALKRLVQVLVMTLTE